MEKEQAAGKQVKLPCTERLSLNFAILMTLSILVLVSNSCFGINLQLEHKLTQAAKGQILEELVLKKETKTLCL